VTRWINYHKSNNGLTVTSDSYLGQLQIYFKRTVVSKTNIAAHQNRYPNVALIGLGYWGPNLLRNFTLIGCLRGVFDIDTAAMTRAVEAYPETRQYPNLEAVLNDSNIDAVAISTPAATHGDLVSSALKSGKHVFVEKPLCLDIAQGKSLRALATETQRILMVGHLLHYHPAFIRLKEEVDEGTIGNLQYIYSNRLSLGKIRLEENALWSFAPHDIAMLISLAGEMPLQVSASGGSWLNPPIADSTISHFTFSTNLQAHIFVSWLHPYKEHRLVVVGSKAMIEFNDSAVGEDKLRIFHHDIRIEGRIPIVEKASGIPLEYDSSEPLLNECLHFINCINHDEMPKSNATEGLQVLSVLDACQHALVTGQNATPEAIS
jgi:UDP-2-acetamido-3-amino-2,3-dideoxy-glucuronate N-acetyltransferase